MKKNKLDSVQYNFESYTVLLYSSGIAAVNGNYVCEFSETKYTKKRAFLTIKLYIQKNENN